MSQVYREKILRDIDEIPADMLPRFYKIVHLLKKEWVPSGSKPGKRNSLKGIWKGSDIDDRLFDEAKKSMFNYE